MQESVQLRCCFSDWMRNQLLLDYLVNLAPKQIRQKQNVEKEEMGKLFSGRKFNSKSGYVSKS